MSQISGGAPLGEHMGQHGREILCYVCKTPLKRVKTLEDAFGGAGIRKWGDVYVCEKGHVCSGGALVYLDSHDLP